MDTDTDSTGIQFAPDQTDYGRKVLNAQRDRLNTVGQQDFQREQALNQRQKEMAQAQQAENAPFIQGAQKVLDEPLPDRPKPTDLPEYKPYQVDPGTAQEAGFGLMTLALLAGGASHGNWLSAASAFNGAMEGYIQGNEQKAKDHYQQYQEAYKRAKDLDQQKLKEYDDVLNNRQLRLNDMADKMRMIGLKYQDQAMVLAADQKNFTSMTKQHDELKKQFDSNVAKQDRLQEEIDARARDQAAKRAAANQGTLSGEALRQAADRYALTLKLPYGISRADKLAIMNEAAIRHAGENLAFNSAKYDAERKTYSQLTAKSSAIKYHTDAIEEIEPQIKALIAKINKNYPEAMNKSINETLSQYSGKADLQDLQELRTISRTAGRLYEEATTMPASNAQMNVASIDDAREIMNENMPLNKVLGALKGIHEDARGVNRAMERQMDDIEQKMEGGGAPAAKPAAQSKTVTTSVLSDYAKKHSMSEADAKTYLNSQGYNIQ